MSDHLQQQDDIEDQQEQLDIGIDESEGFKVGEDDISLLGFKDEDDDTIIG